MGKTAGGLEATDRTKIVRKAFLITAFGEENSENPEEHRLFLAREKFERLVLRAVEARLLSDHDIHLKIETGLAYRKDEQIYDKVVTALVDCDFVIAHVSGNKPNVYLESGYADAYQRKPVLVQHRHEKTEWPSDWSNKERQIYTDADLENPNALERLIDGIVDLCRQRLRVSRGKAASKFMQERTEVARGAEVIMFNRYSRAVKNSQFTNLLVDAEDFIRICVPKLKRFTRHAPIADRCLPDAVLKAYANAKDAYDERFYRSMNEADLGPQPTKISILLQMKVLQGVNVDIITTNPDSFDPNLVPMRKDLISCPEAENLDMKNIVDYWQKVRGLIEHAQNDLTEEAVSQDYDYDDSARFRLILVSRGMINYRVTQTEKSLLYTFRYLSERVDSHHCIEALAPLPEDVADDYDRTFYEAMDRELAYLCQINKYASEEAFLKTTASQ